MSKLTCKELIDFLDDYQNGQLDADTYAAFEQHLAECPYCKDYLKTYQDTVDVTKGLWKDDADAPPPPDAPDELIEAILDARKRGSGKD